MLKNIFNTETMEENTSSIESLIEKATEYGKTSLELAKLHVLDKTAEVVSSLLSNSLVLVIISSFMLFVSLGLALWLGEILGKIYFGFFIVAGFYGLTGILIHFFLRKWLKKCVGDSIIKQMLKQTPWNL
jgi:hypothetical protein